jgi:hypothetical protein
VSTVIYGLLEEEKKRNIEMQEIHLKEIALLPKGAIAVKKSGDGKYYYLRHRVGDKVVADYIGSDESVVNDIRRKIAKRKHLQGIVKRLKLEYKQISKIVKE